MTTVNEPGLASAAILDSNHQDHSHTQNNEGGLDQSDSSSLLTNTPLCSRDVVASKFQEPSYPQNSTLDFPSEFLNDRLQQLEDLGLKSQGLPIRMRDLSVYSDQLDHLLIESLPHYVWNTFLTALRRFGRLAKRMTCPCIQQQPDGFQIPILVNLNGIVHQSELLLVLGRPRSGMTSLLRAISLNHESFSAIEGHIDFGSLTIESIKQHSLRSQVVMVEESDDHFASLTVQETLDLAARCKVPRSIPVQMSRDQWVDFETKGWASTLRLSPDTLQTYVGPQRVGSISGGERKRVSVIEALLTRCSVLCLDNVTAGLDSANSYRLIRSLKQWAKLNKTSSIIGLRQVSDSVYGLFDKVSVLYNGHQIYYGRCEDAVDYFIQLGFVRLKNQPIADFLCSVTDPSTRQIRPGFSSPVPVWPRDFGAAFEHSKQFTDLKTEMIDYDLRYPSSGPAHHVIRASQAEKDGLLGPRSHWTVNYFRQVYYLTLRQYSLIRADLRPYATKTVTNILLSIIIGTLFYQLPLTTDSAFTRASILFLSVLFNGYLQLSELGNTLLGRPIVKRHAAFGFYSPSALALARTLSDLPLIAGQVALFASITYLLAGLQYDLNKFLVYLVVVYATAINLTAIFRMFASLAPSYDEAMRACGICLNFLVVYGGYFIPTPTMRPWLRWIRYYIDPVSYAFEAVISNEFHGVKFQCSPDHIVPRGPTYNNPTFQTCSSPGSKLNSTIVLGDDYILSLYGYKHSHIWKCLMIIVGLGIIFLSLSMLFTELFSFSRLGSLRLFKNSPQVRRRLKLMKESVRCEGSSEQEEAAISHDLQGSNVAVHHQTLRSKWPSSMSTSGGDSPGPGDCAGASHFEAAIMTFSDLAISVETPIGNRTLLEGLVGYVRPGECTALMGPSGAGKTTLLNALAGRAPYAKLSGNILINGRPPTTESYKSIGYVEQSDSHDPYSTVRESLEFSALLRQPNCVPRWARLADVDRVIALLGLEDLEDAIVGTTTAGLGLEDRKKLSIAVELVAKPQILCLDEPISGLDSQSAAHIIALLKRLVVETNLTVVVTVHQPSVEIFECFDRLILLAPGGKLAYFGARSQVVPLFEQRYAVPYTEAVNPAEYLIELVSNIDGTGSDDPLELLCDLTDTPADPGNPRDSQRIQSIVIDQTDVPLVSYQTVGYMQTVNKIRALNLEARDIDEFNADHARGQTIYQEVAQLTLRFSRNFWRDSSFSFTQLFTSFVVSKIISLTFFQEGSPSTLTGLQNQMFSVFLILFLPPVFMNQMVVKWFSAKAIFQGREKSAGLYREVSLAIGFMLAEAPYCVISAGIFWTIWFFGVGFPLVFETMCFTFIAVQLFFFFQVTWAMWIAALAPTIGIVANIVPFFLLSMELFNGSLLPYEQMPGYWRWMYWVSPFQWYVRAVLSTVLHKQQVFCQPREIVHYMSPPSIDCKTYSSEFLEAYSGYLIETSEYNVCGYCKYSNGDEFLKSIGYVFEERYRALAVFALYGLTNVILVLSLTGGLGEAIRSIKTWMQQARQKKSIRLS